MATSVQIPPEEERRRRPIRRLGQRVGSDIKNAYGFSGRPGDAVKIFGPGEPPQTGPVARNGTRPDSQPASPAIPPGVTPVVLRYRIRLAGHLSRPKPYGAFFAPAQGIAAVSAVARHRPRIRLAAENPERMIDVVMFVDIIVHLFPHRLEFIRLDAIAEIHVRQQHGAL